MIQTSFSAPRICWACPNELPDHHTVLAYMRLDDPVLGMSLRRPGVVHLCPECTRKVMEFLLCCKHDVMGKRGFKR